MQTLNDTNRLSPAVPQGGLHASGVNGFLNELDERVRLELKTPVDIEESSPPYASVPRLTLTIAK